MIGSNLSGLKTEILFLRQSGHIDMKMEDLLSKMVHVLEDLNRRIEENERRFDTFQ